VDLFKIILVLGIVTYSLVWLLVLTGSRKIKVNLVWHRRMGYVALTMASIHAAVVLYTQLF
jgi:hypothetical protein